MTDEQNRIAAQIVGKIIADLCDRRGLRQEWEQIDDDIRAEIEENWMDIATEALSVAPKEPAALSTPSGAQQKADDKPAFWRKGTTFVPFNTANPEWQPEGEGWTAYYPHPAQAGAQQEAVAQDAAWNIAVNQVASIVENWPHDEYWPPTIAERIRGLATHPTPGTAAQGEVVRELRDAAGQLLSATMYKDHPFESQRLSKAIIAYDAAIRTGEQQENG